MISINSIKMRQSIDLSSLVSSAFILTSILILTFHILISFTNTAKAESFGDDKDNNNIRWIPTAGLPDNKLISNFGTLKKMGIFSNELRIKNNELPWSSSYFPAWYGGVAGRWQDSEFVNIMRTLFTRDTNPPHILLKNFFNLFDDKRSARKFMDDASASEKYDLAVGDYRLTATKIESAFRGYHSGSGATGVPLTWAGYCNGVSAAGLLHAEPFRQVEVISSDGVALTFYPNDVKALLSMAYFNVDGYARIGNRCDKSAVDLGVGRIEEKECRDLNAASFVLALANRLGIAGTSFVIDKKRFSSVSNHPIGSASVAVVRGPYLLTSTNYKYFAAGTKYLVDVKMAVNIGSTSMSYHKANIPDEERGPGYFKKVGYKGKVLKYTATLELDKDQNIIGGEWTGSRSDAPDFIWFGERPSLTTTEKIKDIYYIDEKDALKEKVNSFSNIYCNMGERCDSIRVNPGFQWSLVEAIYKKSVSTERDIPVLDLRARKVGDYSDANAVPLQNPQIRKTFKFETREDLDLNISVLHFYATSGMQFYGFLSGVDSGLADIIEISGVSSSRDRIPVRLGKFDLRNSTLEIPYLRSQKPFYIKNNIFINAHNKYLRIVISHMRSDGSYEEIASMLKSVEEFKL
ncbi:MAG: hypothetical protein HQK51_03690 [Oligoflexia bacterium]|nr:hypothetical protein [Oligoflexia bacterium]